MRPGIPTRVAEHEVGCYTFEALHELDCFMCTAEAERKGNKGAEMSNNSGVADRATTHPNTLLTLNSCLCKLIFSITVGTWAGGPKGPLGPRRIFGWQTHIRPLWAGRPPIDFYHHCSAGSRSAFGANYAEVLSGALGIVLLSEKC
eukprot:1149374-Pelagomonas_calceolata.AAC.1